MKKLMISLLALLASFACFTACGSKGDNTPASSSDAAESESSSSLDGVSESESSSSSSDAAESESPSSSDGTSDSESTSPTHQEALDAVKEFIHASMIADSNVETREDYTVKNTYYSFDLAENVTITWSVDVTEGVQIIEGEEADTVDVDEALSEDLPYVLTATITDDDGCTVSVSFERKVLKAPQIVPVQINKAPEEGKAYKYYVYQSSTKQDLYFSGKMALTYYFGTVEDMAEAKDLYVEYVDATYFNVYFMDGETKTYIGMKANNGHDNVIMDTSPISTFRWSEEHGTILTNIVDKNGKNSDFYLGNYGTKTTISGSNISFFGGEGNNVGNFVELLDKADIPADYKLETEKDAISIPAVYVGGTSVELTAVKGTHYPEVHIAWSSTSETITVNGATLTIAVPSAAETVTLTATLTVGDQSITKDFAVTVIPNEASAILEAATALKSGASFASEVALTGTVTEIVTEYSEEFGNVTFNMLVGEVTVEGYRAKGAEGVSAADVAVGDTVTLQGILKNYNGTIEFDAGSLITALDKSEPPENPDTSDSDSSESESDSSSESESDSSSESESDSSSESESDSSSESGEVVDTASISVTAGALGVASNSYASEEGSATLNEVTFGFIQIGNYSDGAIRFRTKDDVHGSLWNTTAIDGRITKIVFTHNPDKKSFDGNEYEVSFGTTAACSDTTITVSTNTSGVMTIEVDGDFSFFKITHMNSYTQYWNSVEIFYDNTSSGETTDPENPETSDSGESSEVVDSSESSEVVDSSESSEVVDSSESSEVVDSSESSEVVDSSESSEVVDSSESSESSEVVDSSESNESSEVVDSSENSESSEEPDTPVIEIPEAGSNLTIAQAVTIGSAMEHNTYTEGKYYVSGTIQKVTYAQLGNMYIEDENGTRIYIYGLYNNDGTVRYDALEIKPVVGDTIKVLSVIGNNDKGAELKDAWIVVHTPKADSTLTIAQAVTIGSAMEHNTYTEGKYYVSGTIKEVKNATYGNVVIEDESGNSILVRGTWSADGSARYDALEVKPIAGDEITVYGIVGQYNGTAQIKDGWITAFTDNTEEPDTPTIEIPKADSTLTIAQAVTIGSAMEHNAYTEGKYYVSGTIKEVQDTTYGNVVIEDGNGNSILVYGTWSADGSARYGALEVKPIAGDEITVYGIVGQYNGTAQIKDGWITAFTDNTPEESDPEAPVANLALSFADVANRTSLSTEEQVWEQNGVTLTNKKGSSGSQTNVADYAAPARFYANSSLTIECTGMKKITFNCNSAKASYATALNNSIAAAADDNVTVKVEGSVVTVEFATAVDSFAIAALAAQVRLDSLAVVTE